MIVSVAFGFASDAVSSFTPLAVLALHIFDERLFELGEDRPSPVGDEYFVVEELALPLSGGVLIAVKEEHWVVIADLWCFIGYPLL